MKMTTDTEGIQSIKTYFLKKISILPPTVNKRLLKYLAYFHCPWCQRWEGSPYC